MLHVFTAFALLGSISLGQTAFEQQRYPEAIQYFQQALTETPQSYEALYGLAKAQAFQGEYTQALETYNTLLALYPDNGDALLGRAQVQSWLKKEAAAIQDFEAVLAQQPEYTEAWQGLARLYLWQNNAEAFQQVIEQWQQAHPQSPAPLLLMAQWQIQQRQFALARQSLTQAKTRGASSAEIDSLLARINRLPGALPWEASLNYELQGFTAQQVPWHTVTGGIKYNFEKASLALQSISTQRFGLFDQGFIADSYVELWSGAYANIRAQAVMDADVLPQFDLLGELYQSFAETWEVSGAYRLMSYPSNQIHFIQGSVGKYWGNWYFRLQPMLFLAGQANAEAGPGGNLSLWARYYYGTVDDFVEMRTGLGRRIAVIGTGMNGPELQGQSNAFALLSAQHFISPQLGFTATLNYNYDEQFADRFGGSIGTLYRF